MFFFLIFILLLTVPTDWFRPVSSWRMGRSPPVSTTCSRNDRPRGLRPNKVCLAWHHGLFQHLVKIGGDNQWQGLVPDRSNISCNTQLSTRVDDCLAQIFRRAKWLYTRARIWIFAAFILRWKLLKFKLFFGYNPLLLSSLAHIKKYFDSFIVYYPKQPTFDEQILRF